MLHRLAVAASLLLLAACADGTTAPAASGDTTRTLPPGAAPPAQVTAAESRTIAAANDFSLALFREVSRRRTARSTFISPYSAAVALAMTTNGAAGETEAAMLRTLGVGGRTLAEVNESHRQLALRLAAADTGVQFVNANAVWYDRKLAFERSFLETIAGSYAARVEGLDFGDQAGSLAKINGWARDRTFGKIDRVLTELRAGDQAMFLMNALYFKAAWTSPFDSRQTAAGAFRRSDGATQTVDYMTQRYSFPYYRGGDLEAIELPYGGGRWVMTVIVPAEGRTLDATIATLDAARWQAIVGGLRPSDMQLYLPKFSLRTEDEWKDVLSAMGMQVAFTPGSADFTRMSSSMGRRLFLEFVKQNTFVDVTERGTEAGAVTTVGVGVVSMPPTVRVDRAFAFAIRERETGALVFLGKVGEIPR